MAKAITRGTGHRMRLDVDTPLLEAEPFETIDSLELGYIGGDKGSAETARLSGDEHIYRPDWAARFFQGCPDFTIVSRGL